MSFNLNKEIEKFTSKVTDTVSAKAKSSAISTLKDPEFKAAVSSFTKDWIEENKFILAAIFGTFLLLSLLAVVNIISNFQMKR